MPEHCKGAESLKVTVHAAYARHQHSLFSLNSLHLIKDLFTILFVVYMADISVFSNQRVNKTIVVFFIT